jgi:hypothetical protein
VQEIQEVQEVQEAPAVLAAKEMMETMVLVDQAATLELKVTPVTQVVQVL